MKKVLTSKVIEVRFSHDHDFMTLPNHENGRQAKRFLNHRLTVWKWKAIHPKRTTCR